MHTYISHSTLPVTRSQFRCCCLGLSTEKLIVSPSSSCSLLRHKSRFRASVQSLISVRGFVKQPSHPNLAEEPKTNLVKLYPSSLFRLNEVRLSLSHDNRGTMTECVKRSGPSDRCVIIANQMDSIEECFSARGQQTPSGPRQFCRRFSEMFLKLDKI